MSRDRSSRSKRSVASDTITRSAPAARATAIGILATRPPSARIRPFKDSGAKTRGMAKLARTARARSPEASTTAERSARSAATARKGIGSESKFPRASRFPRSMAALTSALTSASPDRRALDGKPPLTLLPQDQGLNQSQGTGGARLVGSKEVGQGQGTQPGSRSPGRCSRWRTCRR